MRDVKRDLIVREQNGNVAHVEGAAKAASVDGVKQEGLSLRPAYPVVKLFGDQASVSALACSYLLSYFHLYPSFPPSTNRLKEKSE